MTTPTAATAQNTENMHGDAACVKLFTDTLERLNQIAEQQMQSILDLAIAAADAANSINPSDDQGAKFVEKTTAAIDQLKANNEAPAAPTHDAGEGSTSPATGDAFCRTVENDIAMAFANSLALQQQLNVIGTSVLVEGAKLVMTAGGEVSGG